MLTPAATASHDNKKTAQLESCAVFNKTNLTVTP